MVRPDGFVISGRKLGQWAGFLSICFLTFQLEAKTKPDKPSEFLIQTWGLEEGLPQSSVTSIVQTPDGYLWFGTFDGLVRFDGARFTVFGQSRTPGLAGSGFVKLFVDKSERLWMSTTMDSTVSVLEKGVFKSYSKAEGLPIGGGLSFFETDRGELWLFGGSSAKVRQFDGSRFLDRAEPENVLKFNPAQFARDSAGTLYAMRNDRLAWFDRTNWNDIVAPDGSPSLAIRALAPARAGGLWMTINNQVARLQQGAWVESVGEIPWAHEIRAFAMLEDSTGGLWIGTYGAGLFHRTTNGWTRISHLEGLPHDVVRTIFEDHEGSIWIGTDGGGLVRLKPKLFTNYGREDGLPENVISAVREVRPGELWVGTHGGGLAIMRGTQFTKVDFPRGANNRWIWALTVDHAGTVWGGTFGPRLFSFPGGKYTEVEIPEAAEKQSVNAIVEADGALWVATRAGLLCYTNGGVRQFTKKDGLADDVVHAILPTPEGGLWLGTEGGLTRYQEGKLTRFEDQHRLENIRGLADADGALWVGMGNGRGLAEVRNGRVTLFEKKDGLPQEHVESIVEDGLGNLWLAGNRGVCRARLSELEAFAAGRKRTIDAFLYGQDDGLGSNECPGGHQPDVWKSADGRLWFGTVGGLSSIDPQKVKPNTIAPRVWIEEALVDGKPLRSALESWSVNDIVVAPGAKRFEIHYTALSFLAPGQVLFKYRLENFDHEWNMVGNRRVAYYQGLAPGHYRFQVAACNNHGVWNETGAALGLVIRPFVWQTGWFRVALALGMLLALLSIYHRRVSVLKRERQLQRDFSLRLIASQEQERKRLAGEIHDSLGQNLLIIKNRAAASTNGGDPIPILEQMEEISKTASEAIQEIRTISHNLRPYQLDRLGLTMALQAIVKQFDSRSLTLHSEIASINKLLPPEQEINFYRIIQESLNNIIKHSAAKNAWLIILKEETRLVVTIRDDGRGFDYKGIIQDPLSKRGLGLTGLMERARSLGGELQIDSVPGRGTLLTLTVPL